MLYLIVAVVLWHCANRLAQLKQRVDNYYLSVSLNNSATICIRR